MLAGALAGNLAANGHDVEMLTTCAVDHYTWKNELPPGPEQMGHLLVRRFPADARDLGIFIELEHAIAEGLPLSIEEQHVWLRNQVSSSAMEDFLADEGKAYDLILPIPYLFGTSYFAYRARPERVVPIPCLHDEAYAYLPCIKEMLEGSRGVMFNAAAEARLAHKIAPGLQNPAVVGMGFEPPGEVTPEGFRKKYGLTSPFLLYLGRREGGKNVPLLIDYFMRYKGRRAGDLTLAFVGKGDVQLPDREDIVELELDWNDRDSMYAAATAFCQPSINESFSIVIMQAWLASCPVLVHARCEVTREHCGDSNGGLWFGNYAEFEDVLDRLVSDERLRLALGRNGSRYVRTKYSWQAVTERVNQAIQQWAGAGAVA